MSEALDDAAPHPLDALVEQFVQRRRRGEPIDVATFCAEHPTHAAELRELLPMMVALEDVKRDRASSGSERRRTSVPQLGQLGDFRIVRELGRGGMGVVFEAVQQSLGRKVALKVLPQASLLTGNQLTRFQREAQIAAQLHHTNIVPVYGSGETDGYHWYAMQFIAGESLEQWRRRQSEAPPRGAGAWQARARFLARLGAQAASALHYAHGSGTLHRDIKPGNLLLEGTDQLWITDFGLAKALADDGLTRSGDVLGTLQYMAPEQFAGSYDVRSEVYALGVTLYELATLQPAFVGTSRSELMERIRTQRAEPLRRVCPELPTDLRVIIDKAMARDPRDRYADAQALAADLQAFLADRRILARPTSVFGEVWRWCRRNRTLAALAGSTLLAVVAAAATGWVAYVDALEASARIEKESQRADANLRRALAAFGEVFDDLVGRDPTLAFEVDAETGESTVITRQLVDARSIETLQGMLRYYSEFAQQNEGNQQLRVETARANRRVGAIHVRLGKPENLIAARQAYARATTLLDAVTDRDVARDKAAVLVDLGRLEHRERDLAAASRAFRDALAELDRQPAPATVAVRFERAQAHYLLAQLGDWSGPGAGRGPVASAPGGGIGAGGGPDRREVGRVIQTAPQHLQAALTLVGELLQAEPNNFEVRALEAKCLLLSARLRDGRRGERSREGAEARERDRERGITILRELLQKHPEAEALRFALAEALLPERPGRPGREPRDGASGAAGNDNAAAVATQRAAELERWREAKRHAEQLLREQPRLDEYAGLLMRTCLHLARALRERADAATDDERTTLRHQALAEAARAIEVGTELVPAAAPASLRFLRDLVDAHRLHASLLLADKQRERAIADVEAVVTLLERQLTLQPPTASPRPAGPPLPTGDLGDLGRLEAIAQGAGRSDLVDRLRRIREQIGQDPRRPR